MEPRKIILVFKTHFDIGFTDLSSRVIDNYAGNMLDEVIATCRATQKLGKLRYVWTMPAWPLWYIVNHCAPEKRAALEELIDNGQVVWHALPFTSHTDFCSQQEYIEGLIFSKKLSERYHKPMPVAAKMTDVPGHSLMLPDILAEAGIAFLHLGCNEFATPPDVPELFFWQAPGKRRVLTMYSRGGYGTGLMPPADWEFPVWMALMHTHDNCGPQSADAIVRMQKKVKEIYPDAEVVCGTMDDFYRELSRYDLSNVPVVEKDLADTWIHGVGAYPKEVSVMRQNRRRMEGLQALYAQKLLRKEAVLDETEALMEAYYEQVCLFEEHTWGADVKTWLGSERVYEKEEFLEAKRTKACLFMEASWEEQRDRARKSSEILDSIAALLGEKADGKKAEKEAAKDRARAALCAEGGQEAACGKMGMLSLMTENGIIKAQNHRYSISFEERTGEIIQVYDKKLACALLEKRDGAGVFSYRYDKYGYDDINEYLRRYGYHFTAWGILDYGRENYPFCAHETFYPRFEGYEADRDTLRFFYTNDESAARYGDAERVTLEISMPEESEKLYVTLKLSHKQETPFVEAGSFILPLQKGAADIRIQKGGVMLDPKTDIEKGANHSLYCLENGLTARISCGGIGVCSLDAALVSMGSPGVYEYHPVYEPREEGTLYFNLFNNMWGTNFPQWMGGDFCYTFVIEGKDKADASAGILDGAIKEACGAAEKEQEAIGVKFPKQMRLIGAGQSGDGFYLRFSDLSGKACERVLEAPGFVITPVDLWNCPKGEAREGRIDFTSVPYGVMSFFLKERKEA